MNYLTEIIFAVVVVAFAVMAPVHVCGPHDHGPRIGGAMLLFGCP